MPVDPHQGSPFPGLPFAGPQDEIKSMLMEIPMSDNWLGYANGRVMTELKQLHPGHQLQPLKGRTRIFQLGYRQAPDGKRYLAIMINDRESRPARQRKSSAEAQAVEVQAAADGDLEPGE